MQIADCISVTDFSEVRTKYDLLIVLKPTDNSMPIYKFSTNM